MVALFYWFFGKKNASFKRYGIFIRILKNDIKLLYFSDKQYDENVIINENKLLEEIKRNGIWY